MPGGDSAEPAPQSSAFDLLAPEFERHRGLPPAAIAEIRAAVRSSVGRASFTLLDLGAGTGRLGRAFLGGPDLYVGIDRSFAMLARFRLASESTHSDLAQADGGRLPFRRASFGAALLAHVLTASNDWQALLTEARRVLDPDGVLFLAQRVTPGNGLDARLREQLRHILARMGVPMPEAGKVRSDAQRWIAGVARSHEHIIAARWPATSSPSEFVVRHSTGARFATLSPEVQRESLRQLSAWVVETLGALDRGYAEEHRFELDAFRFASE